MASGSSAVPVIGIDLGTTYSCVAVWLCERVEIIPNEQGNRTTPSFVSFTDKEQYLIGEGAKNLVAMNPTNTVFDTKRLIGRRYDDARVQGDMKVWPFKIVEGKSSKPMIVVTHKGDEKKFTAEDISSMVLTKVKEVANSYLNTNVKSAVITVPAYFDDLQRKATKDAATVAGLDVLRLLNEPTAAAIAYGLQQNATINGEINILIFDLGGGTFDVSVVTLDKGKFKVKAVDGDTHLGGEDFDNRMVEHFFSEFRRRYKRDVSRNPKVLGRLKVASEKAKRILSSTARTSIEIDCLYDGIDFSSTITRAKFEELNKDFFDKCIETVQRCLDDAKLEKSKVDEVVLVGGSTRIPKVQRMLQDFFNGKDLCKKINPDEAVAYGAAVLAENISSNGNQMTKGLILSDVTLLSLGVELNGEVMHVMIQKNTLIPVTRETTFYTVADNQSTFLFKVYQGENRRSKDNTLLGEFELSNLPLAPKGVTNVRICFDIDGNGILKVSAKEAITGQTNKIIIRNGKGSLQTTNIKKMLDDADKYEVEDHESRNNLETYKALEDYIYVIKTKMTNDQIRRSLSRADLKDMDDVVEMVMDWLEINKEAETKEIEDVMKEVKQVCNSILRQFILE